MSCNGRCHWMHLWTKPFEVRGGAAWFIEYCRCDGRRWHVINPLSHEPSVEDQPAPAVWSIDSRRGVATMVAGD